MLQIVSDNGETYDFYKWNYLSDLSSFSFQPYDPATESFTPMFSSQTISPLTGTVEAGKYYHYNSTTGAIVECVDADGHNLFFGPGE